MTPYPVKILLVLNREILFHSGTHYPTMPVQNCISHCMRFIRCLMRPACVFWRNSGASVDEILDFLRNRAPDAYAAILPDAASRAAEQGEIDVARAIYSQLVELHPENTMWKDRIAQLQPETLAVWNFDTGLGTWDNPNNCELSVRDGVLQVTETAADPHFFGPVAVRSGANALVLRYRREQPFWLEYYCGDALGDVDQSSGMSIYQVPGTEGTWRELLLPLSGRELPNALRLDLNLGMGQTVEIDSMELRHVDTAEYARLAREVVVEPTLARLQAEIDREPQSAEKYSTRATYLMRLGRWREAAADARQSRKLEPTNRGKWFSEANCVLLAGDEAAYRQLCQEMIEQFRGTADDEIADSVCKTCVLLAGTIELSELPIQMLRTALDEPQKSAFHNWFLGTAALYAYRDDKYDEAIAWTKRNSSPAGQTGALALVVCAMAEHQLGQHEQAAQTLAQAEALIPGDLATLGTPDDTTLLPIPVNNVAADWLTPEILRREAATLIFPQSSDPQRPGNRAP